MAKKFKIIRTSILLVVAPNGELEKHSEITFKSHEYYKFNIKSWG